MTDTPVPEVKTVTFKGRTLAVTYPDWQAWVALHEAEDIAVRAHAQYIHYRDQAGAAADAGEDTTELSAKAVAAGKLTIEQAGNLLRVFRGILAELSDYSWLVGQFASKDVTENDLADLIGLVMEAFGSPPEPANRQQRRRAKRT